MQTKHIDSQIWRQDGCTRSRRRMLRYGKGHEGNGHGKHPPAPSRPLYAPTVIIYVFCVSVGGENKLQARVRSRARRRSKGRGSTQKWRHSRVATSTQGVRGFARQGPSMPLRTSSNRAWKKRADWHRIASAMAPLGRWAHALIAFCRASSA